MSAQENLDQTFGQAIRTLRTSRAISQEALAIAADVDQSRLSKVERTGPGKMTWSGLCRVADALGCEIEITLRPKTPPSSAASPKNS